MYAFALWDFRENRLLVGRDRLGEKPLYLYPDERADGAARLWWSSELSALLRVVPRAERRLSIEALHEFLTFQYCFELGSPVRGITQLPPAHVLEAMPERLDAAPRQYWSMLSQTEAPTADPVSLVRGWVDRACRRMGTADVPVGVALSGGIDSSLMAAITGRHYPGQIHAFTVGYVGRPQTDERLIAQRLARSLNVDFTEVEVDPRRMVEDFPTLVKAMDTPIGDIAGYGYFEVCRAARAARVPVLLSGMGGDEFFWGYEWVRNAAGACRDRKAARERRDPAAGLGSVVRPCAEGDLDLRGAR